LKEGSFFGRIGVWEQNSSFLQKMKFFGGNRKGTDRRFSKNRRFFDGKKEFLNL
jgi:hypothetical protein